MDKLPSSTMFVLNKEVQYRRIDQEAVVIHQSDCKVLVLNDVGTRILELIDEGMPIQKLTEILADEYDVDPKKLQSDLLAHIEELASEDIINRINHEKQK